MRQRQQRCAFLCRKLCVYFVTTDAESTRIPVGGPKHTTRYGAVRENPRVRLPSPLPCISDGVLNTAMSNILPGGGVLSNNDVAVPPLAATGFVSCFCATACTYSCPPPIVFCWDRNDFFCPPLLLKQRALAPVHLRVSHANILPTPPCLRIPTART